uniref:IP04080p n=1 Tax=Drosophila melanogaster TaxID=7227 RepID=Q4V4J0_DROME|nr:IP04080p [Drosophila melanogaster]
MKPFITEVPKQVAKAVVICALIACVAAKPGLLHTPLAALPAPVIAAPAPVVTAASSQVVARTFNGIAAAPVIAQVPVAPAPVLRTVASPSSSPSSSLARSSSRCLRRSSRCSPGRSNPEQSGSICCSHCHPLRCSVRPSLCCARFGQIRCSTGLCPSTFELCRARFVVKENRIPRD